MCHLLIAHESVLGVVVTTSSFLFLALWLSGCCYRYIADWSCFGLLRMTYHTNAAIVARPTTVTPAAIPSVANAPKPWLCDVIVYTAACVDAENLDERATVSIKDVVRTKAEVDVIVEVVGVGVTNDELVCSSRKNRRGLVDVSRGSISNPCLLYSSDTEARKANEKLATAAVAIESILTRLCS
jgi:hypothetical protein